MPILEIICEHAQLRERATSKNLRDTGVVHAPVVEDDLFETSERRIGRRVSADDVPCKESCHLHRSTCQRVHLKFTLITRTICFLGKMFENV